MFWKFWIKNKKTDVLESTVSAELPNVKTNICHAKYTNLDIRRAVLDWRDQQIENIELHLAEELTCLNNALDEQTDKMSISDLLTQKKFGKKHCEPIFKNWVEREIIKLGNAAQKDLSAVFTHALKFDGQSAALNHAENSGHYTDAAIAAAATGAGLAAIPAVTTFSITGVGGFMGLLGATAVVWPVVAVGVTVIAGLLALGGYKAASLKSRAISRYRKDIRKMINEQILGYGSEKDSIRQRLQSNIYKTAEKIILEIDKC